MIRKLLATAVASVLLGTVALASPAAASNPSGLPWRSGAYTYDFTAFGTWRGHTVDTNLQYSDRGSWGGIEYPWMLDFPPAPGELVIAQPFWPQRSGGTLSKCASGSYDTHWRRYGTNLVAAGLPSMLTELAWEMNGNWWEWSATNTTSYINCWRKVVNAVHVTAPNARFLWTINAHTPGVGGNPMNAYPGDAYVTELGIDAYDHYPKSTTDAQFTAQATAVAGITWLKDQAVAHGKKWSVPEWGVSNPVSPDYGGDNAFFVSKMQDTFRANLATIDFESYFDAEDSEIFDTSSGWSNPNAASAYIAGLHP
jgi:hypothetical protein